MAPVRTGSITLIQSSDQNPAAQNITVPADATLCLVAAGYFNSTTGMDFTTLTLNGVAFTSVGAQNNTTEVGYANMWVLANPATGIQSLDWAWSNAPSLGANIFVVFYKDADTSAPIRGFDVQAGVGWDDTITTDAFATSVDDTVLCIGYGGGPVDAAAGAGQTEIADSGQFNFSYAALGEKAGVAGTTTMAVYGSQVAIVACSIKPGAAGPTYGPMVKNPDFRAFPKPGMRT